MLIRKSLFGGVSGFALAPTMRPEDESGGGGAPAPAAEPPAADPPAPAEPPVGDPPAEPPAPADAGGGGDPPAGDPDPKPARVPWQVKRIDALTAQNKAADEARQRAEAAAQEAQQQLAAMRALYGDAAAPPAPAGAAPAATTTPAGERTYTQSELQAEAARIAGINALNQRMESLFDAGAAAHGADWQTRVTAAGQAFGQELAKRPDLWEAITALPNGADVYHALGGDLDHFADVLAMPPVQLGMELAKLSAKAAAGPKVPPVSRVPAPIVPLEGGGGGDDTDLSKVSMAEYAATREKQIAKRREERGY